MSAGHPSTPAAATDALELPGVPRMTADELRARVAAGARLVRFEVCVSALVFTVRRQSAVHLTLSRRQRVFRGLRHSLASLLLGPWGVPWGLAWTAWAVWVNLTGGVDETDSVLAALDRRDDPPPPPAPRDSQDPDNRV